MHFSANSFARCQSVSQSLRLSSVWYYLCKLFAFEMPALEKREFIYNLYGN